MVDTKGRLSISKMAQLLDVSTTTVKRWYSWYENDNYEKPADLVLPKYIKDSRGTKFFLPEDIEVFERFKDMINNQYRGVMAEFNAYYQWGRYGKTRLNKITARRENNYAES
jgi:hypothetical protein